MSIFEMRIKPKEYEPSQKVLIALWEAQLKNVKAGFDSGYVTFINKRPKNPKSNYRRIAGIMAESTSYLQEDKELVKMTEENFIYLMAKMGIHIEVEEVE